MNGGLHRPAPQFQVEFPGIFSQGIEGVFHLVRPHSLAQFEGFQLMGWFPEQLAAVIAAGMPGDFLALLQHADQRVAGAQQQDLASRLDAWLSTRIVTCGQRLRDHGQAAANAARSRDS